MGAMTSIVDATLTWGRTASTLAVLVCSIAPAHSQDTSKPAQAAAANLAGLHDFAFLVGEWRVHHRVKRPAERSMVGIRWDLQQSRAHGRCGQRGRPHVQQADRHLSGCRRCARTIPRPGNGLSGGSTGACLTARSIRRSRPFRERRRHLLLRRYGLDGKPMRVRFIWSQITSDICALGTGLSHPMRGRPGKRIGSWISAGLRRRREEAGHRARPLLAGKGDAPEGPLESIRPTSVCAGRLRGLRSSR